MGLFSKPITVKAKVVQPMMGEMPGCQFEFEDGQRGILRVPGKMFAQLVPGDTGTLTYKGNNATEWVRD
ncbi:MAG: DUF2500 domain-containing protein [Firmicutes bacterium]|nr:DUF2500 domain-containing protein [Bacillota bacterium]